MSTIKSKFIIHPQIGIGIKSTRSMEIPQDIHIMRGQDFFIGSSKFKVESVSFSTTKGVLEKIILLRFEGDLSKNFVLGKTLDNLEWK